MQRKPHTGLRAVRFTLGGFALIGLIAATTLVPASAAPNAPTAPQPLVGPDAPWDASTGADILALDALDLSSATPPQGLTAPLTNVLIPALEQVLGLVQVPADGSLADVHLVHSGAEADSTGPVQGDAALRSHGQASNLSGNLAPLDLGTLLTTVDQVAPPDNAAPTSDSLLTLGSDQLAGLAALVLGDASAQARWAGDTQCVAADTPVAQGVNAIARASVLPAVSGGLLSLPDTVEMESEVSLPENPDGPGRDPRIIKTSSTANVASVNLLGDQLKIGVLEAPKLVATATGLQGGANVEWSAPVVTLNGDPIVGATDVTGLLQTLLKPLTDPLTAALNGLLSQPPLSTTLDLVLGATQLTLDAVLGMIDTRLTLSVGELLGTEEAADGTHAKGEASLLQLTLTVLGVPVLKLAILPMTVEANAPLGGLDCQPPDDTPVDIRKDASAPTVSPGDTFDYIVTVTNISDPPCPVTNATVIDTITGPAGSTIVGTDPPADSAEWPTVRWTVPGPIEPGQSIQLKITVRVPTTAQNGETYTDKATISEGECGGVPFAPDEFTLPDIPKIVIGVLPRTGSSTDSTLVLLGVAGLLSAAAGLRRLRRV